MKHNTLTISALLILFSAIVFFPGGTRAEDWPQFRGPRGEAVSPEKNLPTKWSATENIRWKAPLPGRGVSSPIVAGGRIYITACTGYEQSRLHVLAFDAKTGNKLWEREVWSTHHTNCHHSSSMAANTPVSDGENVYALFATGDLAAFDKDGNLLWYRSLGQDYPGITNQVGMAASLVVWKNTLIVPMENAGDSFALALKKTTGENLWKIERPRQINWVTPLILNTPDSVEVVFQSSKEISAYDPENGKQRWTHNLDSGNPTPVPLHSGGTVFASGKEYTALTPGKGDKKPEVVWSSNKIQSGYTTPVLYRDKLYFVTGAGVLNAVNAKDGTSMGQVRVGGKKFWASPLVANGNLYVTSEDGVTTVVKSLESPGDSLETVSTNELGDTILATPALSGGCVYLRSDKFLYCVGAKK